VGELTANGHEAVVLDTAGATSVPGASDVLAADLRDAFRIDEAVAASQADACVHLGAVAFVPAGTSRPAEVMAINAGGTINVLNAFQRHMPEARILVVSTAQVYALGRDVEEALTEDAEICPSGVYAISKAAADLATLGFGAYHRMHTMTARPSNHIGPGQSPRFVAPSFAQQVAEIAAGRREPVMAVGNLDCLRDFTDVRDVVRAYRLLLEKGQVGAAYNIGSGKLVKIQTVLDSLCGLAGITPEIRVDPDRYRPTNVSPVLDTNRLRTQTGWQPNIPLVRTLEEVFAEARGGMSE